MFVSVRDVDLPLVEASFISQKFECVKDYIQPHMTNVFLTNFDDLAYVVGLLRGHKVSDKSYVLNREAQKMWNVKRKECSKKTKHLEIVSDEWWLMPNDGKNVRVSIRASYLESLRFVTTDFVTTDCSTDAFKTRVAYYVDECEGCSYVRYKYKSSALYNIAYFSGDKDICVEMAKNDDTEKRAFFGTEKYISPLPCPVVRPPTMATKHTIPFPTTMLGMMLRRLSYMNLKQS